MDNTSQKTTPDNNTVEESKRETKTRPQPHEFGRDILEISNVEVSTRRRNPRKQPKTEPESTCREASSISYQPRVFVRNVGADLGLGFNYRWYYSRSKWRGWRNFMDRQTIRSRIANKRCRSRRGAFYCRIIYDLGYQAQYTCKGHPRCRQVRRIEPNTGGLRLRISLTTLIL